MLDEVSLLPPSTGIVFLGDIFELWIGLKRYEDEGHRRFLDWCRSESAKRDVVFTEGNHEFYLALTRKGCFRSVSRRAVRRGNALFLHGDRINRKDVPYLLLRMGVRNAFTRLLLRLTGRAFGPALTHRVRLSLKTANMVNKKFFPEADMRRLMAVAGAKGVGHIFIGHFHDERELVSGDGTVRLHALPAFLNTHTAGLFDPADGSYVSGPFGSLAAEIRRKTTEGEDSL